MLGDKLLKRLYVQSATAASHVQVPSINQATMIATVRASKGTIFIRSISLGIWPSMFQSLTEAADERLPRWELSMRYVDDVCTWILHCTLTTAIVDIRF